MYARRDLIERLEPPLLDVHAAEWLADGSYRIRSDARRFENWETNYASKIGLGVAVDYALGIGVDAIKERVYGLGAELRERLSEIDGVTVHDLGVERCGIVTFSLAGRTPTQVADALRAERVNTSVSPLMYSRLDFDRRGITDLVRASAHYYNTSEEIERLVGLVRKDPSGRA